MALGSPQLYRTPPSGGYKDLVTSDSAAWTSLRVRLTQVWANQDEFESAPNNDLAVHVSLNDVCRREAFVAGRWRLFDFRRGMMCTTPPNQTWRIRYTNCKECNEDKTVHIYIPRATFQSVAEKLLFERMEGLERAYIAPASDETVQQFAISLIQAARAGASNLYAEASAHWLSAHLLLKSQNAAEWHDLSASPIDSSKPELTDPRLLRVLEYIRDHLSEDLDLKVLARETGLSPFHFATLFHKAIGKSPHKHVLSLRMGNAASLLGETKRTSSEIALLCGFRTASHFGVAFHKHFGRSPGEYRHEQMRSRLGLKDSLALRPGESASPIPSRKPCLTSREHGSQYPTG